MRPTRSRLLPLLFALLLTAPGLARAAGPVGVEFHAAGGYRHSVMGQGGGLDFGVGLDIRLAFLLIGVEIRPAPGFKSLHRLHGLFNLTLFVPAKVVRPFVQLSGGGGALFNPNAAASGVLRQAIGMDFFIKKVGLGFKFVVDETTAQDLGIDVGVGGMIEFRIRG